MLGPLLARLGSATSSGFVTLGPNLSLPGGAVHVVGRPATLSLGPTAGNLSGARHAAVAIVSTVVGRAAAARLTAH